MTISYAAALKNTRMQAVLDAFDAGAAAAYLEICTTAYGTVLVTITFADPSFTIATDSLDTLTMAGAPKSGVAANPGTAAMARIKDSDGNIVAQGLTVGTATDDEITINSTSISAGQTITITAGTIQHG